MPLPAHGRRVVIGQEVQQATFDVMFFDGDVRKGFSTFRNYYRIRQVLDDWTIRGLLPEETR
jgi:hypothetical protein